MNISAPFIRRPVATVLLTAGIAIHALPQMLIASALLEHGQWASIVSASRLDWATFAAFKGAGMTFKSYNGRWKVLSQIGITFT